MPEDPKPEGDSFTTLFEKFTHPRQVALWTVLGGIAGVVGLLFAVALAIRSGRPADGPVAAAPTATQSSSTVTTSSAPTAPTSVPSSSAPPTSPRPAAEPIRHRGTVSLREEGTTINLDAPPSDRQWKEGDHTGYGEMQLLEGQKVSIFVGLMSDLGPNTKASYDVCSGRTDWGGQDDNSEFVRSARDFTQHECYSWSIGEGPDRFARIIFKSATADTATFDITVWDSE